MERGERWDGEVVSEILEYGFFLSPNIKITNIIHNNTMFRLNH